MADIVTNTLQIGNDNLILRDADAQEQISELKEDLSESVGDLKSALGKTAQLIDNLFNSNDIIEGKYLKPGDVEADYSTAMISNYFPCAKNETFITEYSPSLGVTYIFMYDASHNYLGASAGTRDGNYVTYTTGPANSIAYGRINNDLSRKNTLMIVKGETYPSKYIPYNTHILKEDIPLTEKQYNEINTLITNEPLLYNKKLSVNGDSICYGAGYTGGYGKIISERCTMPFQNIAVSGGTIAANTYSDNVARHWVCRTISNMDSDSDYILIEGGVNDAALQVPLGTISQYYETTFDDTTFYGAMESICKQLTERFANKKIGFIIPHGMTAGMRKNGNYNTAIYEVCNKWGVPILDLSTKAPPFAFFPGSGSSPLSQIRMTNTLNGDGWHPTQNGYEKYYIDKIIAWMKTL